MRAGLDGGERRYFGKVLDYTVEKGYGFISYEHGGKRNKIFAHHSQIICTGFRKLKEDMEVSFAIGKQDGRDWAMFIKNADGTPIAEIPMSESEKDAVRAKKRAQGLPDHNPKEPRVSPFADWKDKYAKGQMYACNVSSETRPNGRQCEAEVFDETCDGLGHAVGLLTGFNGDLGGNECARSIKKQLPYHLRDVMRKTPELEAEDCVPIAFDLADQDFLQLARHPKKNFVAGASCGLAVLHGDFPQLLVATCGDVLALLCTREGKPQRVGQLHTVKAHLKAMKESGATVGESKDVLHANDDATGQTVSCHVARCFGAKDFKKFVEAEPTVAQRKISDEVFLLFVSRSVWELVPDAELIKCCLAVDSHDPAYAACKAVCNAAVQQGEASGQVSACIVEFGWRAPRLKQLREDALTRANEPLAPAEDDSFDMFG